ncbi:MAG TPA: hypothetical protein VF486_04245 [Actinomycetes bacterium]
MVLPRGTYTSWRWRRAAAGASGLAWDLTVLRDPGPTTYFWAQQWSFQRGNVGYFGLQAHDLRDDGSVGKLAVFSIWSAVGGADNPGAHAGVEGTPFWTCRLGYGWEPGRTYRLAVRRTSPGWWRASVSDVASGAAAVVGSIQVPPGWGGLDLLRSPSLVWTEFYGANAPGGVASCEGIPHAAVRFGFPSADGADAPQPTGAHALQPTSPAGHANWLGDGDCPNSRVGDVDGGVVHEMGIPEPTY